MKILVPKGVADLGGGLKDDQEKDRHDLVPLVAEELWVKVLTVGPRK